MSVRRQIDGNAVEKAGQVSAMVEVETSKKILVRLAVAAVLGDDDSGHGFEHFPGTADGAFLELLSSNGPLRRSIGDADHAVTAFFHYYLGQ